MAGDVEEAVGHVAGEHVGATAQQCQRASGGDEAERGARAGAVRDVLGQRGQPRRGRLARRLDQTGRVVDGGRVDEHGVRRRLQGDEVGRREDAVGRRWVDRHAVDDGDLFLQRRVAHDDLHQEPVALGLGQLVHALGLDRVLRRHHDEGLGHRVGLPRDRHLLLLHHLQQRRLDLRRRAVDLVGQHEVREHRAQRHVKCLGRRLPDPRADDVGRHEIRGELQADEAAAGHLGQGRHRKRLGQAGRAFDEAVAPRQQAGDEPLDHVVVADDDLLDLKQRPLEDLRRRSLRLCSAGHAVERDT